MTGYCHYYNMKNYLRLLLYLLGIHTTALAIQACFRLLLLLDVSDQLTPDVSGDLLLTLTAFVRGLWFDNVIGCYILLLPLVMATVGGVTGYLRRPLISSMGIFFGVTYCLVFMATAANIPYFEYFTKPLNSSIWNWAEYGTTTLGMMFGEQSYYLYMGYFFLAIVGFSLLLRLYGKRLLRSLQTSGKHQLKWQERVGCLLLSLPLIGLCIFGIRGRTGYNPIKVSAAYFCSSPVLNQLGVNPMFCLLTSTLDDCRPENRTLHLMDAEEAVSQAQHLLQRKGIDGISPIARQVEARAEGKARNVVLVFLESFSAKLLQRFGGEGLTPTLDSLWQRSLSFSNFYSAGNHTNHGLYASLYGFPSIMKRNAMKGSAIPNYSGLPTVLQENGYQTMFFMTHEAQYDNMNAFFRSNGFGEIYSQENYPKEKIANHFGVQDDYLFEYALPVLNKAAATGRPFFAALLTITNHPPYMVPNYFTPRSNVPEKQVVEYTDWAVKQLMDAAARQEWFDNTLFVFLGDHGKMVGQADCELPESYNHVPFFIYGKDIAAEERSDFSGQIDLSPTLLGMLGIDYVQNNFGVDLNREKRPCIFYTADNTIAARDSSHLYVYNPDADKEFCYTTHSGKPEATNMSEAHSRLKNYCFSMLQATEQLIQKKQTVDHATNK